MKSCSPACRARWKLTYISHPKYSLIPGVPPSTSCILFLVLHRQDGGMFGHCSKNRALKSKESKRLLVRLAGYAVNMKVHIVWTSEWSLLCQSSHVWSKPYSADNNFCYSVPPPLFLFLQNSIRHNLSLHDMFVRETSANGKISFWTIHPDANRCLTLDQVFKVSASCRENGTAYPVYARQAP